jgi:hypothetical protein
MPVESIDKNLKDIIALCGQMLNLADRGDEERTDAGCGVIYGTLRDAAYKVRQMAQNELQKHTTCAGQR